MNKCSQCGAALKTLTRVCEACGSEIKPEASASSESSTAKPVTMGAAELSAQINEDLSLLKSHPPLSNIKSFLTGLITLPTIGLGYLAVKALEMFGRVGQSPERVKLSLEQNLRAVVTGYKSDPEMRSLEEKGRSELEGYLHSQHETRKFLMYGMAASLILSVTMTLVIKHQAKVKMEAAAAIVQAEAAEARARMEKAAAILQAEAAEAKAKMEKAAAIVQAEAAEAKANLQKRIAEVQNNPFKTLCVGPITAIKSVEQKTAQGGQRAKLQQALETLDTTLIDQVNASRKFEIVARNDALKSILNEQEFGASGIVEPATAAQAFKVAGAQYFVMTTVTDFVMGDEAIKFEGIGVSASREAVRISCSTQIYDTTTGKLIESARFRSQDAYVRREGSAIADGASLTKITDQLAADILNRIIDVIYPAKVAAKLGAQITINRGEGTGVAVGQTWTVFALGQDITDPDTGGKLGRNEAEIGRIKITRVTPKLSYGDASEDNGISVGNITRPQQSSEQTENSAPAKTQKPKDITDKVKGDL